MDIPKESKFIQLIPNSTLHIESKDGDNLSVDLHTNSFLDIEVLITDKIYINILGKPPVKKIIYG